MNTLPIIVSARNEEHSIEKALHSFSRSTEVFCKEEQSVRVVVIVCVNASSDRTLSKVLGCATALNRNQFEIHWVEERLRGKLNGLRTAIGHLRSLSLNPAEVVFADADVEWVHDTLSELWRYWKSIQGKAELVGAMIQRNRAGPQNIFEHLESLFYIGYGKGFQGQGVFARFVSGMTYIGDVRVLRILERIPVAMGNEDVALSFLVGRSRIHICPTANVKYTLCNSWEMFTDVRGRHIRECHRLRNWVARRLHSKLPESQQNFFSYCRCYIRARQKVASIAETRTLPVTKGFIENLGEIWSPKRLFVAVFLIFPTHTYLKIYGCVQLITSDGKKVGWETFRSNRGGPHK